MVVELNSLVVEGESFELVIEEEVDCLFIQLESQTLQERDVVVYKFIVFVKLEFMRNQLI